MAKSVKKKNVTAKKTEVAPAVLPFPSYIQFTKLVYLQLKKLDTIFLRLVGLLAASIVLLTASSQQAIYTEQAIGIQSVGSEVAPGILGKLLETGILFATLIGGTLTSNLSESQQLLSNLVYLFAWLVVVWLMRHILSGKSISVRDGLYNAGAPVVSTMLVALVAALQLIPLAILVALLSAVVSTGSVSSILLILGVLFILAMTVATLYWLVGTLFAAIIVTIPGTYPIAALRSARGVVAGYRARILKRLLWLGLVNVVTYMIVIMPILFIDSLTGYALSWITVICATLLSASLFIYSASYLYLLYRRIIDERAD